MVTDEAVSAMPAIAIILLITAFAIFLVYAIAIRGELLGDVGFIDAIIQAFFGG